MAQLEIIYRALDALTPAAINPRTHSDAQVAQIAASIAAFGFTSPILIDEHGGIIAGHGRLAAARTLGLVEVPTIVLAGLSDAQKRALVIADNKLALNAGWDDDLLASELDALKSLDFDLSLVGFGDTELDQMLAPEIDPAGEWQGMPAFEQPDNGAIQTISVHFKERAAVEAFATLIGQTLTEKTRFVWFPQAEIERYADKRYAEA